MDHKKSIATKYTVRTKFQMVKRHLLFIRKRTMKRKSSVVLVKNETSPEFVSKDFESLDYDRHDNEVIVLEEEARGKIFLASVVMQRILLFIVIGVICGICGAIMELGVHYGTLIRYHLLKKNVEYYRNENIGYVFALWIVSIFVPAIFGSVMVLYGDMRASGGGVHWCLGYLNGINLNDHLTFRILVIKALSCILCVVSGLPGGKEAPLIHMGSIVGALMPMVKFGSFQPFDFFQQDPERRDMASAGAGAGLTAAFSTPLAGIMMSFEECMSFWNLELTFLIFVCTISTYISLQFLVNTVLYNCPACVAQQSNFFLDVVNLTTDSFFVSEIFAFICLGIIGGLQGALWNSIQRSLILLRQRFVNTQGKKLVEITVFIIIVGICQVSMLIALSEDCIKKDPDIIFIDEEHDNHLQLDCPEGEIPIISLLLMQDPVHIMRSVFTSDLTPLGIRPLFFFWVFYFLGSTLLCGMVITHGTFIPHLLTGAVFGRLLAEFILYWSPESKTWANPNKFAFLSGAAELSGSFHLTYTISVMMLETCNSTNLAIPIFIVACFAKFAGSIFNESICHTQSDMAGLPLLQKKAPLMTSHLSVGDVMATPVRALPLSVKYGDLLAVIRNTGHNGFPVVDYLSSSSEGGYLTVGSLKGLIDRSSIIAILNGGLTEEHLDDIKSVKEIRKAIFNRAEIKQDLKIEENKTINLEKFMNISPYIINVNSSFPLAYSLFSNLGIRHLVVVNNNLKVVGIITRKDLSIYRHHAHLFKASTVILPIR